MDAEWKWLHALLYLSVSFADAALDNMQIGSNRSDFSAPPPAIVRIKPPALIVPAVNFTKCIIGI